MQKSIFVIFIMLFTAFPALSADGMVNIKSAFSVQTTADRMANILNEKGMVIFNRIKHSESAAKVGIEIRETQLLIFGNPKAGGPLMKCKQSIALDLPQKAFIWKAHDNQVWISYNDPKYLVKRHDVTGCEKVISKIGNILKSIVKSASNK
jgi:uncharacterized protein (DUF302 family)